MTLWRLEWLRLLRTRRLVALTAVYAFFGIVGPLTARYLRAIIDRFGGGDLEIIVPDPVPADGLAQFATNASQIGLLVAIVVGAGALVLDAVPEMGIFLRTRVRPAARLVLPRYGVVLAAATGAAVTGTLLAWYETAVLIGPLPATGVLGGMLCTAVYLAFVMAVVASVGSRTSSVVGTVLAALVVLLLLPLVGIAESIGRWLPSHLVGAPVALVGDGTIADFAPAAAISVAAAAALLADAMRATSRREI